MVWNPDGSPRWIRCYDNGGETFDRYTVVFTRGKRCYLGMSQHPAHPQGYGMHGEWPKGEAPIDRLGGYSHLGKKIKFSDLPEDCQKAVNNTYGALWSHTIHKPRTELPFQQGDQRTKQNSRWQKSQKSS